MNQAALVEEILHGKPRVAVVGRLKARKCSLCPDGIAPPGMAHCRPCEKRLKDAVAEKRTRARAGDWKQGLFKVAYWRGCAVGFYSNGATDNLGVRPLFKDLKDLPKCKLINLDAYCEGYNRDQIAMMKRWIRHYFPNLPPAAAVK